MKSLRVVEESSRTVEGSFSRGHVSLTHDKIHISPFHALNIVVHALDQHPTVESTITCWFSWRSI